MGIDADMTGLHITPDMPSTGLTELTLNQVNFRDMSLDITTTNTSVRIKARENNNKYTDWVINGKRVQGLFDVTVDISKGETVSLYRDADAYTCTVTFDAGTNGTLTGNTKITVNTGTELSTLTFPTVTQNEGFEFVGWSQTSGAITTDITITAQYLEIEYEIGDVNRDGELNIVDTTDIQMFLVGLKTFNKKQYLLAEFDKNGYVNIKDVTYIQMHLAGLLNSQT